MRPGLLITLSCFCLACMDLGDQPWEPQAGAPPAAAPVASGADASGAVSTPDDPETGGTGEAPSPCPHPDGLPREAGVEMLKNRFEPTQVTICAGDTVVWTNRDTKAHTVVTGMPKAPDGLVTSTKIYFGQQWSFTFSEPGEYVYYCTTHKKKMRDARVFVL